MLLKYFVLATGLIDRKIDRTKGLLRSLSGGNSDKLEEAMKPYNGADKLTMEHGDLGVLVVLLGIFLGIVGIYIFYSTIKTVIEDKKTNSPEPFPIKGIAVSVVLLIISVILLIGFYMPLKN